MKQSNLYTMAEFSRLCGVSHAYVSSYIKRRKLVKTQDNLIDLNEGHNQYFFEIQKMRGKTKPESTDPFFELLENIGNDSLKEKLEFLIVDIFSAVNIWTNREMEGFLFEKCKVWLNEAEIITKQKD